MKDWINSCPNDVMTAVSVISTNTFKIVVVNQTIPQKF